jgi:hypothetical protein
VLSHYLTDPLMPLHTGQTEDEAQVHKFIEWGTSKIYRELVSTHAAARAMQNWKLTNDGDSVSADPGSDWLALMIIQGAQLAHRHYDTMIDDYDPAAGSSDPASGFGDTCRNSIAMLLGWSIKAVAYTIDRAIIEADVSPPKRSLTASSVLSTMSTPIFWITRRMTDKQDRKAVSAIWNELQKTGKVVHSLPEDDRAVRAAHASEVLKVSLDELDRRPIRKAGTARRGEIESRAGGDGEVISMPVRPQRTPRAYLRPQSHIVEAPSIGPKTADRLQRIGIHTVRHLLAVDYG